MISPQNIKYNGININDFLSPLTVILDVAFDSDNGAMSSYLNRSAVASESYDGRYKNTYKYKYDELFSPQFTIVKADFSDFTQSEIRQILKYFTQTDKPALLEVDCNKEGAQNFCAIGGWTSIETYKLANARTVGIIAKFEAITPYAMSDIIEKKFSSELGYSQEIDVETDDNKPIYPLITVKHKGHIVDIARTISFNHILEMADYVENTVYYNGSSYYYKTPEPIFRRQQSTPDYGWPTEVVDRAYTETDTYESNTFYYYKDGGMYYWIDPGNFTNSPTPITLNTTSIKIVNQHYDESGNPDYRSTMIVKNNTPSEEFYVDGANKIISSTNTSRIFGDNFVNWAWLPLYDGKNLITIEGNCEVTLTYRTVIKCGEY